MWCLGENEENNFAEVKNFLGEVKKYGWRGLLYLELGKAVLKLYCVEKYLFQCKL